MISVICACNNQEVFEKMLLCSLNKQTISDWELIVVDAKKEGLPSASAALNWGADRANGNILLFVHQDVEFLRDNILELIEMYCAEYDFGVAGVAGRALNENDVYASVIQGKEKSPAGEQLISPRETDSLDECLFFIKKDNFKGFEDLGETWHFYAVEYSQKCRLNGEKIMLFPLEIYHLSPGWSLDNSYWKTLKLFAKKSKGKVKYIITTMGVYRNNFLLPFYILYRKFKKRLKG